MAKRGAESRGGESFQFAFFQLAQNFFEKKTTLLHIIFKPVTVYMNEGGAVKF